LRTHVEKQLLLKAEFKCREVSIKLQPHQFIQMIVETTPDAIQTNVWN